MMVAAAFMGLAYCSLPTLLFGMIRPYAVSMGAWPTTRSGVVGLALIQLFFGIMGCGFALGAANTEFSPSMIDVSLGIAGLSGLWAFYRLLKGPKADQNSNQADAPQPCAGHTPGHMQCAADGPAPTPHEPAPSPLDALDPQVRADMEMAMENIARLRRWVCVFHGHRLQGILAGITELADTTVQEVLRDPGDFARVRPALVHHLNHVVAALDNLATVHVATGREELLDRTATTLAGLIPVFESFRDKAFADETLQLDAHLQMLDQAILTHTPQS